MSSKKHLGSGCGTTGALLELASDIYSCRMRSTDVGGTIFDSSSGSSSPHQHQQQQDDYVDGGNTAGRGGSGNRRATTALQARMAEAIGKTSDSNLILASRRWFVAVFRAMCVWLDDHPSTPLRRGFVGNAHDFFDSRLLVSPSDLIYDLNSYNNNATGGVSSPTSPSPTSTTAPHTITNNDATTPATAAASQDNNNETTTTTTAANETPTNEQTTKEHSSPNPVNPLRKNSAETTTTPIQESSSPTISQQKQQNQQQQQLSSTQLPVHPGDILRRFMLRASDVFSCQWIDGAPKLRAVLERPIDLLFREISCRTLGALQVANTSSSSTSQQNSEKAANFGEFEGLVLEYVQDEDGVWTRGTPLVNMQAQSQLKTLLRDMSAAAAAATTTSSSSSQQQQAQAQGTAPSECHGFGLENVAPSWHAENRYTASQFAEPNSLMVSRTSKEVVVALPWGERERVYAMLFFPPHVDDRYARFVAWDIYVAARLSFGEDRLAAPSQRSIRNLCKRSQKSNFNSQIPSKEIVQTLGRLRSKIIPESVNTCLALRRRFSPCPVLPIVLNHMTPAQQRNDVAVERIILEICAYVYRALGSCDFAIFHDHRVLYTNVSLSVTGVMQNAYHMLRTHALDGSHFGSSSEPPGWSGSNDLDHVNDAATLIAPIHWPPGQCLTQLSVEGTPQDAEMNDELHRMCALWTVGHNNFGSSSVEVVFVLPQNNNNNATNTCNPQQQQQQQQQQHLFNDLAWSKKEPTLLWEIHDNLYPLFVLSERLNDAILFCQRRQATTAGTSYFFAGGDMLMYGNGAATSVSITPDGTATNAANRSVTYELHKLGYAQTLSSMKNTNMNTATNVGNKSMSSNVAGTTTQGSSNVSKKDQTTTAAAGNTKNVNSPNATTTNAPAATGLSTTTTTNTNINTNASPPPPPPSQFTQTPNFSLSDYLDPDSYELDRLTRLSASFVYSTLKPSRDIWCGGGSSYSVLFSNTTTAASSSNPKIDPCVRLRSASVPGVVLTTSAGADSSQFTLSESKHSYSFPI